MQFTGAGEHPVLTWTITRANRVIAVDYEAVTGARVQFVIFVILVGWL